MNTETIQPLSTHALEKFQSLIKDIKTAMLTTIAPDGSLRSRPMATLSTEFDGDLWFFTSDNSPKVYEIVDDQHVGLSYASFDKQEYVSVSGIAGIVRDPERARQLWTPAAKPWFPEGPEDPHLVLLRVRVTSIEYWDAPASKMVMLYGMAKAMLTGDRPKNVGEHKKINIGHKSELM